MENKFRIESAQVERNHDDNPRSHIFGVTVTCKRGKIRRDLFISRTIVTLLLNTGNNTAGTVYIHEAIKHAIISNANNISHGVKDKCN